MQQSPYIEPDVQESTGMASRAKSDPNYAITDSSGGYIEVANAPRSVLSNDVYELPRANSSGSQYKTLRDFLESEEGEA
jgi:hypothetical protein